MDLCTQRKVFTKWINAFLPEFSETHFYEQLRDARTLARLLSSISNHKFPPLEQQLSNRDAMIWVFKTLKETFFINIQETADSILSSDNFKEIHNFLWSTILHFVVSPLTRQLKESSLFDNCELALLQWCRNLTFGYKEVYITNFSSSWRSGLAFNAILHKHHPRWFEYSLLLGKPGHLNLEHAFQVAEEKLAVSRLLDCKDIDIDHPDDRSIILYLISCLEKLLVVQNSFALPFENVKKHDKVSPPNSPVPPPFNNFSTNFDNFLLISEGSLTWLREDLNLLSERRNISGNLEILRDQFHQHETFMLKLTERQDIIGQILMGGIALAKCTSLDDYQKKQIDRQIEMINESWEELRTKAMERQNNLHSSLIKEQQMEIETFANHLSSFENKVRAFKRRSAENGIDQLQVLEWTLISLQKEVSSLQSMLLVVDEAGSHLAMENQLEELGKRWLEISSEMEDLKHFTEILKRQKSTFVMKLDEFKEWLMETEALLNGVLRLETGDGRRFSDENLEHVVQQVKCLKTIENNMEKMVEEFQKLNTLGSELANVSHDEKMIIDFINRELQSCQERWDTLVRNMEALSKDISESGIEIAVVSNESGDQEGGFEQDFKTSLGNLNSIKLLSQTPNTKDIDVLKSFQGFRKTCGTESDDEIVTKDKERIGSLRCKKRKFSDDELKAIKPFRDKFREKISDKDISSEIVQRIKISKNGHDLANFTMLKKIPRIGGESSHPSEKTKSLKWKSFESLKIDFPKSNFDSVNLKQEFDKQVAALNQWLDQAEVTQEMVSLDSERFDIQLSLNVHEQEVLIEDAEKDVVVHLKHLENLQITGKFLCEELLKSKKPTGPTVEALKSIERRWDSLLKILEKNKNQLKSTRTSRDFLEQLELLKDAVNGYERWVDEQNNATSGRDFAQLSRLLEQNRVKMKALQSYEDNIRKLKELLQDFANVDELSEKLNVVEQNFKNTLAKMGSRQVTISRALNYTPSKSFSDSLSGFNNWLDQTESKVSSVSSSLIIIDFVECMEKDSKALEDLLDEVNDKLNHLEYLNHATEDIKGRLSGYEVKLNDVCGDIDLLNHRWTHLRDILNTKHERLNTAIEKVTDFQIHCKELTKWLNEMDTFLNTDPLPKGNIDLLKAQLSEIEGVREDIRTMESSVVSMNEVVENFCSNANSSFARKLRCDQEDMNSRWQKICKLSEKQYEILKLDLVRFESLFSKLNSLDKWLDGTVKVNTDKEYKVSTLAEISSLADHFKILLNEFELQSSVSLCEVEKELENIKKEGDADIDEIDDGNIFHVFNLIKERFSSARSRISTLLDKFSVAKAGHNLLSELLTEDRNHLDTLRCQLEKQQNSKSLDAEEFVEELEDLENILSSKNNFEKIMKLSQELANEDMLVHDVHLEEYLEDYKHLHREAKAAASKLSQMISESQERENLINDITQWLWDTNELIREDPPIGEETSYHVKLAYVINMKRDFETRKNTLKELLGDAQTMRNNGRSEAASRLEGQLQLLSKHYKEVENNFLHWQRNGLDEKLIKMKVDLEALDLQLKNRLKSFSSEEIQLFINSRMASYLLISGMKSDFETVMRSGNQVIEKKLTQQPLLLTSQLDDLKNLYNAISLKITRDKNDLEELLRIFRESHDTFEFIEKLKSDLEIHKESAHLENLDSCRQWIKNKNHEIPRILERIISLASSFKQHSEMLEESVSITQQTKFLHAQETLKELLQTLEDFQLNVLKEEEIVDIKYGEFIEIQNNAIEILKKIEFEYRQSKTVDSFVATQEDLLKLLDKCRKLAKEINSRSSKFSQIIDFKVKEVNKQWKHVTEVMEKSNNSVSNEAILCEISTTDNPETSVQEITDLEEIPDFHSVCEELEELNSWINRLESIVEEVEKPIDTSAAYLKADFNVKANKLNNLEQGIAKQQKLNKELEKKLLEHFSLLRLRMKILENELFKNESRCESETPEARNYKISFAGDSPQNFLNNLESLQKLVELIRKKVEDYNSESKQLFSTLPTQAITEEVRLAENLYIEAKSRSVDVFGSEDASFANDILQKIRSCMDKLPRQWIEFPIDESVVAIYEEARRKLTDTKSCLSDSVDVFSKKDLLRARSESNNVLRALGELRNAWQNISEKLLMASDYLRLSNGIIEDCNALTGPLNKAFIKICRRKLKLEKYLTEVEQNEVELVDIQSSIVKVQKLFHINNNAMKSENEIIQLMNDSVSSSQQSYDHLQATLAAAKVESDIIQLNSDVGSKLSLWMALKNQVRALERLNNVLQDNSVDDPYEAVDSKNLLSDDVSISELTFATFISSLASQTSGSPDVDEAVRNFCSSVEVMLQTSQTKTVLCDAGAIERSTSALKESMKDLEAKMSEVISRCSEKSDKCSDEALQSLEEKVRYFKSECHSIALRRKVNLEDILRESNELNTLFDELTRNMEASQRKAEITRDSEKGEVWIEPSQTQAIEKQSILDKIHTFKSRAEDAMHQFMCEDNSLLLQNIQFVENLWRSTDFIKKRDSSCSLTLRMTSARRDEFLVLLKNPQEMNRVSCVRKSSIGEKEAETNRWLEGMKKELRIIKESIPEDLNKLKIQIDQLEALRLKMTKKESETSATTQQSLKYSQENFQENCLHFKSMLDQIISDKTKLLERAARQQDVMSSMNTTLKRLNSVISQWKTLPFPTKRQLESEISSVKAVQSEVDSLKAQLEGLSCPSDSEGMLISKQMDSQCRDLGSRISTLEKSLAEKAKTLKSKLDEICPFSEAQLSMTVSYPWERTLTDGDHPVPYYINHCNEKTQWDHPEISLLFKDIDGMNGIKFSAYRMAMKLRMIRKKLLMDKVLLEDLVSFFKENASLNFNPSSIFSVSEYCHLLSKLLDHVDPNEQLSKDMQESFKAERLSRQKSSETFGASLWIELTLNCLLHFFDSSRKGLIESSCFMIFLVLLSSGSLENKYKALYSATLSDSCMDLEHLKKLINNCLQLPKHLGEDNTFSDDSVDLTANNCLEKTGSRDKISLESFITWMKMEPQPLAWIGVHERLCAAEEAVHHRRCNVCKRTPIVGLRYRCLKCFSFDLCQDCFFRGFNGEKGHKLSHPMQEYYSTTSSGENMRCLTKMFRNKLRSKRYFKTHLKLGYLPVLDATKSSTLTRTMGYNTLERSDFKEIRDGTTNADIENQPPISRSLSVDDIGHRISCSDDDCGKDSGWIDLSLKKNHLENKVNKEAQCILSASSFRLAQVENRKECVAPNWSDEHNLIAQYCRCLREGKSMKYLLSPIEILVGVEEEYKNELETSIKELKEESRLLQKEYNDLKRAQMKSQQSTSSVLNKSDSQSKCRNSDDALSSTPRQGRLEKIDRKIWTIEQQNVRLEEQLKFKKMLLDECKMGPSNLLSHDLKLQMSDCSASSAVKSIALPPSFELASTKGTIKASNKKRNLSKERYSFPESQLKKSSADKFTQVTCKLHEKKSS